MVRLLAFKNDIGFWKKKSNLEGLSVRSQWSSFVCQLIIFANLADTGQASTIILCEMGISVAIEGWKVSKFLASDGTLHDASSAWVREPRNALRRRRTPTSTTASDAGLLLLVPPRRRGVRALPLAYHPQRSWRSWCSARSPTVCTCSVSSP